MIKFLIGGYAPIIVGHIPQFAAISPQKQNIIFYFFHSYALLQEISIINKNI